VIRPPRATPEARNARRAAPGTLAGHGGPVKAIAADAQSGLIATGSFDYSLMLWDGAGETPRSTARIADFGGAVNAVALVPGGGTWVGGGDDQAVWIGPTAKGQPARKLEGHTGKINAIAVSPDGRRVVSASWDRTARIWEIGEARAGAVLTGHTGPVNAAVFSGDGRRVYTASYDGHVVAWDASDGRRLRTVLKHGWGVNVLVRVPGADGDQLLYGAVNGAVGVVDGESGRVVAELPAHERPVLAAAVVAKPGLVATGAGDGTIRVARLGDWKPIETFQNAFGPIWALAFVADGTALYYGSLDDFAMRWQITPRERFEPVESQFPRRFQVGEGLDQGERQFARKCSVCHTLTPGDRNRAGPTLHGVLGRKAGAVAGYPYSAALKASAIVWNEETIGKLLDLGPDEFTPGSKMPLQRITDASAREALITFLKSATSGEATRTDAAPPGSGQQPGRKSGEAR
jgi:cytochrome c